MTTLMYVVRFTLLMLSLPFGKSYRVRWITFNQQYRAFRPYQQAALHYEQHDLHGVYIREFRSFWPALWWGIRCANRFTELDELAVATDPVPTGLPVQAPGGLSLTEGSGGLSIAQEVGGISDA